MKSICIVIGFFLAVFNPLQAQVELDWIRVATGGGADSGGQLTVDQDNNYYQLGVFSDSLNIGTELLVSKGLLDIFIAKYSEVGNLIWVKTLGGAAGQRARSIQLDLQGNIYITGDFSGTIDHPSITATSHGEIDFFIASYDPNGELLWFHTEGGTGFDYGADLAIDGLGSLYVIGRYQNSFSFAGTPIDEASRLFLAKYQQNGTFEWVRKFDGINEQLSGNSLAIDGEGNIFLSASYRTIATEGAPIAIQQGIVMKLDAAGTTIWEKLINICNTSLSLFGNQIEVGANGDVYLFVGAIDCIQFEGSDWLSLEFVDIVAAKFSNDGAVIWRNAWGDWNDTFVKAALDNFENLYVLGSFNDGLVKGFTFTEGMLKIDSAGNLLETTLLANSDYGTVTGIAMDGNNGVILSGKFNGSFNFFNTNFTSVYNSDDGFMARLKECIDAAAILEPESMTICQDRSQTLNASPGFESYLWSTGETTSSITVSQAGSYAVTVTNGNGCQGTDQVVVTEEVCTGLAELNNSRIRIYPNPSKGSFIIDSELPLRGQKLQILDIRGQVLFSKDLLSIPPGPITIQPNLKSGLYILLLNAAGERYQQKLLID